MRRESRHHKTMKTAALLLAATLMTAALPGGARGDEAPTITGNWILDESRSDDPAKAVREASTQSGHKPDGALRRFARSVRIFGIPVGGLPLPSGQSKQDSEVPDELSHAPYILQKVDTIRVLQEDAATQLEYGTGDLVIYRHGERIDAEDATVEAGWRQGSFVVEHELEDGTKITETYRVDTSYDELHWTVTVRAKKAEPIEITRVYERARGRGLNFAA